MKHFVLAYKVHIYILFGKIFPGAYLYFWKSFITEEFIHFPGFALLSNCLLATGSSKSACLLYIMFAWFDKNNMYLIFHFFPSGMYQEKWIYGRLYPCIIRLMCCEVMMTSSHRNAFYITGPLCGESTSGRHVNLKFYHHLLMCTWCFQKLHSVTLCHISNYSTAQVFVLFCIFLW